MHNYLELFEKIETCQELGTYKKGKFRKSKQNLKNKK